MFNDKTLYSPRVTANPSMGGVANPLKYVSSDQKNYEPYPFSVNKSQGYSTSQDWANVDYQNIRRVPDEVSNLRQTFDVRSHSGIQNLISKYDFDNEEVIRSPQKSDASLRQTFNARPKFIQSYSNPYAPPQGKYFNTDRQKKTFRSPIKSQTDYTKYKQHIQKLEASNKMDDEFRKLKEDRRKRLQYSTNIKQPTYFTPIYKQIQKQKQRDRDRQRERERERQREREREREKQRQRQRELQRQRQREKEKQRQRQRKKQQSQALNFKRKKVDDFYSPKYQRIQLLQNLQQSKTMPLKNVDLTNLKSSNQNNVLKMASYDQKKTQQKPQVQKIVSLPQDFDTYLTKSMSMQQQASTLVTPKLQKKITSPLPTSTSPPTSPPQFLPPTSNNNFNTNHMNKFVNPFMSPITISDFDVRDKLGEGKFGMVYRAFHINTGAVFAIKKVPKEMIKKHNLVNQFMLELKLQTFLQHQNILNLYHFFDDATYIYLVLEYMQQGTLFSKLKKKKTLPEKQVARMIKQIASAINYLHQNQVAHRDIKPQNIVLTNGVCKLCDFGWATICNDRRRTCCGTFDYTPPEIFQGEEYDYTVDLWCLGVLTYELLVGKAPFYHMRRQQTKKRILNVENGVVTYPQNLSKNAVSFIESLMKKDPKQRLSNEALINHPFIKNVGQDE